MAATLFVCIGEPKKPEIIGDAVEKNHKDWIVVDSIGFGLERHSEQEGGVVTRGFGKAVFKDVTMSSEFGRHTIDLMFHVAGGKRLKKVIIHQCKADEDAAVALEPYIIWTLEDAQINTYGVSASSDDIPKEDWAIRAAKVEIEYKYPKGGKLQTYKNFKWDIGAGEMG
jgi:type VI protein secretion system component Hcp